MLYIIGFGPGDKMFMTEEAIAAIEKCDLIVGYTVYAELLKAQVKGKEFYTTPMRQEKERCEYALLESQKGRNVALICSGDSGVYGMAALVYELSVSYEPVEIQVVAGVTAALSGGAVLGAPLTNDFAVISLSDLLTPWAVIEKRLSLASKADFVLCLYNPSSKKRMDYLKKACDICLAYKKKDTICGYVRQIGREQQESKLLSLMELCNTPVDMFTTVFIGNSSTKNIGGKMVTTRGYHL